MGKLSGKDGRFNYGDAFTISDATAGASTVVVEADGHTLIVNDRVRISGVVGMTDLNGSFRVTAVNMQAAPSKDTFTVALATSQEYTSGGEAKKTIEITNWEINEEGGEADVSDSATDDNAEYVPAGKIKRSGSFEGFLYAGQNYPELNEIDDFEFVANSALKFTSEGFLTSNKIGPVNVIGGDGIKVAYNFRLTGTLTKTDTTS